MKRIVESRRPKRRKTKPRTKNRANLLSQTYSITNFLSSPFLPYDGEGSNSVGYLTYQNNKLKDSKPDISNIKAKTSSCSTENAKTTNITNETAHKCSATDVEKTLFFDIGSLKGGNGSFSEELIAPFLNLNIKQQIPEDIPRDKHGVAFPYIVLRESLINGKSVKNNCLVWSRSKESLYCLPCRLFHNLNHVPKSILASEEGWTQSRGWRGLYFRIPRHCESKAHKSNYLTWKTRCLSENETGGKSEEQVINENEQWKELLKRILDVSLFLGEQDLGMRNENYLIKNSHNDHILRVLALLSKYDPILREHIDKIELIQTKEKQLPADHPLTSSLNEFLNLCTEEVLSVIISEVYQSGYFGIIVDATSDSSYREQTALIIRYVIFDDASGYCVKERFLKFENFAGNTEHKISKLVLSILKQQAIDFSLCRAQGYDSGAYMTKTYKQVQAHLKSENSLAIYSSCGNHTLNIIAVEAAEACQRAVKFFGIIQLVYQFFSASPPRWAILRQFCPDAPELICDTRWSTRTDAIQLWMAHLPDLQKALKECLLVLNLSAKTKVEVVHCLKYTKSYECILMSSLWFKILLPIHQRNLIIEKREATLNIEKENIEGLLKNDLEPLRENHNWQRIIDECKITAEAANIDMSLPEINLSLKAFHERFHLEVYNSIIHSVITALHQRFEALNDICNLFSYLWNFMDMSEKDLITAVQYFGNRHDKDVNPDKLKDEMLFLKRIYNENICEKSAKTSMRPLFLLNKLKDLKLTEYFPNVVIALRIFCCIPASLASGEQSFSVLNRIKHYLRLCTGMSQVNLAILTIESELARKISFSVVNEKFAKKMARNVLLDSSPDCA